MRFNPLTRAMLACFAPMAIAGAVHAAPLDDLRAEIAAQKARLEKLEEVLQATAATSSAATKKAEEATRKADEASKKATAAAEPAKSKGLAMPAGLSIYGIVDAGVEIGNYGRGSKVRVQSGLGSASRIGFKGERDFGDDLSAYFQLEAGVSVDNGQNTGHSSNVSNPGQGAASSASVNSTGVAIFSRNTFLGVNSKTYGDLRFGRDYAPIYSITSIADPFTIGGATAFRLWSSTAASRFDNALFYATPKLAGFQGKVAYSAGMENNSETDVGVTGGAPGNSNTGPKSEGKGWSASVTYADGPLFVGAGYLDYAKMGTVTAPATENAHRTSWNLAATYDLKVAKFYAQFLHGTDTQDGAAINKTLDRNVWWLGAAIPFGERHTVRAVYSRLDDRMSTNRDSTHYGAGYEFALDKQTDLYVYYAKVTNENGGQNSLCAGGTCQGFDSGSGLPANFSPSSLMLGARYRF
ncbi:porin [Janthinobacterium sp. 17J80-10]|uniref:porin n=1 Tax=Janthinobacterium sp. 17J80-10 TaxID=2497863 RepID=UPI0010058C2E|nr:porin [Janthinobacterium sp. 17J80-10]QAU35667.1 porin [Janthinobacterium sp. 17J80-10]